MGKALYRKYRSKSLDEIVGQGHVTDILARSIKQNRIAHAYLLTGPKGVGKTSIARILAHDINQLPYTDDTTHLDIIEIDAASNNGVEDVRDLREKVQITPVSANKKVYIIDEVHMLSKAAFNALLKTLEEPPEHVVFILATTDVDKLPATIISRTQRFGLRAMAKDDGVNHLRTIAAKEGIKIDDTSLEMLVERGDGSFRNSVSLLDQIASLADETTGITPDLVEATLGLAPRDAVLALLDAVAAHDIPTIITQLDEFDKSGVQASVLTTQLIATIRHIISDRPQLIQLLDALLDVNKSSHPNIKLLTVLIGAANPKPKSVALAVASPSISKPIGELKKAPQPLKVEKTSPIAQQVSTQSKHQSEEPSAESTPSAEQTIASDGQGNVAEQIVETSNTQNGPSSPPGELDWAGFIEYVRAHHIALHSVLSKCGYEQAGDQLKLYTNTAFYKKKLDDPKYRPLIAQCLVTVGAGEFTIETVPTPPPPKDSKAAAIAALMGGGQEVAVQE